VSKKGKKEIYYNVLFMEKTNRKGNVENHCPTKEKKERHTINASTSPRNYEWKDNTGPRTGPTSVGFQQTAGGCVTKSNYKGKEKDSDSETPR